MAIYIICVGPKMVDLHPFHIASFLEAQLDTMVFVGHGQTTPCKEMGPLPTQGLTCWWFHGSMLLQPQGVSDKTNMNQEDSGSTYSNKCLGMDSHCFTYHIASGGINSKQTNFHQGQLSHRWNREHVFVSLNKIVPRKNNWPTKKGCAHLSFWRDLQVLDLQHQEPEPQGKPPWHVIA